MRINGDSAQQTRYLHNALGQRVYKSTLIAAGSTSLPANQGWVYSYDDNGTLLSEASLHNNENTQYIYLPTASDPMPIAVQINGSLYAVHSDHLNTPRRLTSASGQVVWQWAYSAFGEEQPTSGNAQAPVRFNLRFPGQYADEETGFFYNYYRTYNPKPEAGGGRYTQPDPIGLEGGWNRYVYVGGNPLGATDPDGLCPCGKPADVIRLARSETRDWKKNADRSDIDSAFGPGTNKCNLFVDLKYEAAGYHLPNVGGDLMARLFRRFPPGARNLTSPDYDLPGWPVVSGPPLPGDLIASGGHLAIMTKPGTTISAATQFGVIENNWGFRENQDIVVRRCSCEKVINIDFPF